MRCVAGRPGASCCGEPVERRQLRTCAGVSTGRPRGLGHALNAGDGAVTMGDALEVPLNVSVYQRSSFVPPCRSP